MKEELIVLGTGNAVVTRCFNTCFAIRSDETFLVDTGGGNGILAQIEKAGIPYEDIHNVFISHEHTDHLLGIVWLIRVIATRIKRSQYEGVFNIYCHKDLVQTIKTIASLTVQPKFYQYVDDRILFHGLEDSEERLICGYPVKFFDIRSTKAKQFGFTTTLKNGKNLTFTGDEPYKECSRIYTQGKDWLLHEAFCLFSQADIFKPYEKHHSTVKDACEMAESLGIKNLVLWHTEDKNINNRKDLYTAEGRKYFHGNLYVPDDLDIIKL